MFLEVCRQGSINFRLTNTSASPKLTHSSHFSFSTARDSLDAAPLFFGVRASVRGEMLNYLFVLVTVCGRGEWVCINNDGSSRRPHYGTNNHDICCAPAYCVCFRISFLIRVVILHTMRTSVSRSTVVYLYIHTHTRNHWAPLFVTPKLVCHKQWAMSSAHC